MSDWESQPRRKAKIRDETYNREGRWFREFTSRLEPWPVIEQWANDRGFQLAAFKSKRRLYHKGEDSKGYIILVEIRERGDGNGIVVTSWIHAGFLAQLIAFFRHGGELSLDPLHLSGIRIRREACREINELLNRFRQLPILHSDGFHLSDIDPTTWAIVGVSMACLAGYVSFMLGGVDVQRALSNGLLMTIGRRALPLVALALGATLIHSLGVLKRWPILPARLGSAFVWVVAILVLTIMQGTHATLEMKLQKFSYYCLFKYSQDDCTTALKNLPEGTRDKLREQVQWLVNPLADIAKKTAGPHRRE